MRLWNGGRDLPICLQATGRLTPFPTSLRAKSQREQAHDRFEPQRSVTRAEFAALIARALGLEAKQAAAFADVPGDAWYAASVAAVHEAGIVQGRSEAVFEPNAVITREEMAVMLVRAYHAKHPANSGVSGVDTVFTDAGRISPWARDAVQTAAKLGLLTGSGNGLLLPQGQTTRAESAQVIYRLLTGK
ncbi:S-layer homology domain-containing protein [Paenibacillus sp. JTLBN-2024]